MRLSFDRVKRHKTLVERGVDFARANDVFRGMTVTEADIRANYGEARYVTIGMHNDRVVVIVWAPRGSARRVISMRKTNGREIEKFRRAMA